MVACLAVCLSRAGVVPNRAVGNTSSSWVCSVTSYTGLVSWSTPMLQPVMCMFPPHEAPCQRRYSRFIIREIDNHKQRAPTLRKSVNRRSSPRREHLHASDHGNNPSVSLLDGGHGGRPNVDWGHFILFAFLCRFRGSPSGLSSLTAAPSVAARSITRLYRHAAW